MSASLISPRRYFIPFIRFSLKSQRNTYVSSIKVNKMVLICAIILRYRLLSSYEFANYSRVYSPRNCFVLWCNSHQRFYRRLTKGRHFFNCGGMVGSCSLRVSSVLPMRSDRGWGQVNFARTQPPWTKSETILNRRFFLDIFPVL